jgi:hypothetical protein
MFIPSLFRGSGICALLIAGLASALPIFAEQASCPVIAAHELTPAETAYAAGHYSKAEDLYDQAVAQHLDDIQLSAALVYTLLHEGDVAQAEAKVNHIMAMQPNSAYALTVQAEVQIRQGLPWAAIETLDKAAKANPCLARIHLLRSRVLRLQSMYASERAEIQEAYDIDPTDPDIRHSYLSVVHPAQEIDGIEKGLKSDAGLDADTRAKAQTSIDDMMSLVREDSQTCKVMPTEQSATLPLQRSYQDPKHVDGYRLEVQFSQSKARLQVDTAASGIYISRTLADQNGFEHDPNDPAGTVRVDHVTIGPLEFKNCLLGVSETPFPAKSDGFIGTDIFSSYLITLDHPKAELRLAPLPPTQGVLPGDRPEATELRDFTPVYHRHQFLLVPVMLNSKMQRLFVLDTGIRLSTMRPEVAHAISTTRVNFTNSVETVSGGKLQIYRDIFQFQYANLPLQHQAGVLEFDPAAMDHNAGFQVAGMLGFDLLHSAVLHLDYRDGLVKLQMPDSETEGRDGVKNASARTGAATDEAQCQTGDIRDRPTNSVIETKVTGLLDSAHLKPGKQVYVKLVNKWVDPECTLERDALLYGHVVSAGPAQNGAELSLIFDEGDCEGHAEKKIALRLISVIAPPDQYVGLHSVMPSEVSGGGRDISVTAQGLGSFMEDINLNPSGSPHTIHPGFVAGIPNLKLEPAGGAACSDRLTATGHSLRLGVGAELLFSRELAR